MTDIDLCGTMTIKERILSLFILICLASLVVMCSMPTPFSEVCLRLIEPATRYLGLKQFFYMLGPDPPAENLKLEADVTFADRTKSTWQFPNLTHYKDKDFVRHCKEFYYTWEIYISMYSARIPHVLVDAARYAARMNANSSNPPTTVVLYQVVSRIPPLYESVSQVKSTARREALVQYRVQAEDLQ